MKHLKKIIAAIISIAIIFSFCSCSAIKTSDNSSVNTDETNPFAGATMIPVIIPEGKGAVLYEDALTSSATWSFYENGHLEISGNGEMPDFQGNTTVPWKSLKEKIKTVNIGEGITSIGDYAFKECVNITYFVISNTVTHIGIGAFANCKSIEFLGIPKTVTEIGNVAFLDWTKNQTIFFENPKETYLNYDETFCWYSDCEKFYDYDLSMGYADMPVFEGVVDEGELTNNISWAFYGTGELVVSGNGDMPDWEDEHDLPWYDFADDITIITVKNGIKTIGSSSFADCYNVEEVNLPKSLEKINDEAFFQTGVFEEFKITSNITYVGNCVFSDCESLKKIYVEHSEKFVTENWPVYWAGEIDAEIIYTK